MLNSIWPKVQADAPAQALLNSIAKRLAATGFALFAVFFCVYVVSSTDIKGSAAHVLEMLVDADSYLTESHSYVLIALASLVLSTVVNLRGIAILLSLYKADTVSDKQFQGALQLANASNRAVLANYFFSAFILVVKGLLLVAAVYAGARHLPLAGLVAVGALSLSMVLPFSSVFNWLYLPSEELGDKLLQELRAKNESCFSAYAPYSWKELSPCFSSTPQALAYGIALRTGRLPEYLAFFKIPLIQELRESRSPLPQQCYSANETRHNPRYPSAR